LKRLGSARDVLGPFTLTKIERIRKRSDFQTIYRHGRKFSSYHFIVLAKTNSSNITRIGISISKRVGAAVYRNYLKRRIREAFRLNKGLFKGNALDLVVIVRKGSSRLDSQEILHELQTVFKVISSHSY
jgi:ribonuclease P protein component